MQEELLRAFGTLVFIVIALAAVLFFVKRYAARKQKGPVDGPDMRVLNRVNLQTRKQVYMLQVGQRILIVGASEQGINILSEITDPDEVARLSGTSVNGAMNAFTAAPNPEAQRIPSGRTQAALSQTGTQQHTVDRQLQAGAPPRAETPSDLSFSDFVKSMRIKVTPPRKNS